MSTNNTSEDPIFKIVDVIVDSVAPEQVILFGSQSVGAADAESDYDFLVVMKNIANEREISRQIYRALLEKKVVVPVDVVVVDREKLKRYKKTPFFIYARALSEGKIFYDQAKAR